MPRLQKTMDSPLVRLKLQLFRTGSHTNNHTGNLKTKQTRERKKRTEHTSPIPLSQGPADNAKFVAIGGVITM